jgi:hypothetical protein|tara:strand:- start:12703 stop:14892 length:2190 start_codon:yes stop_codon:yes gene_type:complete
MSEAEQSINNVSQSISDLSATLSENSKRFALSSSKIVEWSKSTGKAGKRWTTFSRLTSGTGLWKFQNYLRGTLEVIGAFGERTDEAIKAQTEQEKALAKSIKGVKKINEEYKALKEVQDDFNDRVSKKEVELNAQRLEDIKATTNAIDRRKSSLEDELKSIKEREKKTKEVYNNEIKRKQKELENFQKLHVEKMKDGKVSKKDLKNFERQERTRRKKIKELQETQKKQFEQQKKDREAANRLAENYIKNAEEHIEKRKQEAKAVDLSTIELANYTQTQLDALESTTAFNQAIIRGRSQQEAYAAAFEQVTENVNKNKESYESFKDKMAEAMQIQEAFEKGAESKEFKVIHKMVQDRRKALKGQLGDVDAAFEDDNTEEMVEKLFKPIYFMRKLMKSEEARDKLKLKIQMKALAFQQFMKPILNMAFKFLIFGILGMIALLAVAKVAYDIVGIMGQFGVIDDIKEIIGSVLTIGGAIFGIVGAFLSGDFTAMFDYLGTIMSSLMDIGWNLITIFAKGLFAIAVGLFYSLIDGIFWFFDGGWKVALPALLKLGVTLIGLYFIKYLLSQALLLIGIYALPIMMFVLIAAFVTALFMKLYQEVEWIRDGLNWVGGLFSSLWGWITGIWKSIKSSINDVLEWFGADGLATGGLTHGNTTLVGERGPERVKLPAGSRVYSNSQSRSMTSGSTVINNHITINAKDTSDAELRRIAEKIGNMVNNKMNRTVSSRTLG